MASQNVDKTIDKIVTVSCVLMCFWTTEVHLESGHVEYWENWVRVWPVEGNKHDETMTSMGTNQNEEKSEWIKILTGGF